MRRKSRRVTPSGALVFVLVRGTGKYLRPSRRSVLWRCWHEDHPELIGASGTRDRAVFALLGKLGNDAFVRRSKVETIIL